MQRLAVLPLTNILNDPEQAFFVEGAHEAIISEFQMAGIGVIARRSVMQYEEMNTPIREIAQDLNLDAVLEGSVYRDGDSVGLRVALVDGSTEEPLWSREYGGSIRNVMGLYQEVTRAVANQIRFPLSPETEARLAVQQVVNPEAYDAYLKGMSHWRSLTPQDLDQALQYFEFARNIDTTYALAYSGIALAWGGRAQMGLVSIEEAKAHYEPAIQRAEELGGTIAEVRYGVALSNGWWGWEWEESDSQFQMAIELNPNYPDSHAYYSQLLLLLRRDAEAVAHIEKALELDPFNLLFQTVYGMDLNFLGRYSDAETVLLGILEVDPAYPMALTTLRTTYHLMARYEEALEMWRAWLSGRSDSEVLAALERGYAEGGYSAALMAMAETLVERSQASHVSAWQIGTLFTRAGNQEEALNWLEKAFEEHDPNMPYLAVDPIFDGMRRDPRFQELLRGLGLSG
jgi:TolB-like protein/tetratricopeptide (TPR) repeat protein